MTERRYRAVHSWFTARPGALKLLRLANRVLPMLIYLPYLGLLGVLLWQRDSRLLRAVVVPAAVFLACTALRAALNFPRPYQVYGTPPLTPKDREGQSFPSRHLFSAAVIALCGFWIWPPLGAFWACVTAPLAPARVLAGVHFVRDVLAGAALGAALGWIGFFVA